MRFFNIIWEKIVGVFKDANLKPLDPVPTTNVALDLFPDDSAEADTLSKIAKVKVLTPVVETVQIGAVVESFGITAPNEKPTRHKQLTKNFHIEEFYCHDGVPVPDDMYLDVLELAENLQVLRDTIGKPIKIVSGYRHPEYNKKIGGARNSQHMLATAADIKVKGMGTEKLSSIIEAAITDGIMKKGGVGRYPSFTHYDTRGKNSRWRGTRSKS